MRRLGFAATLLFYCSCQRNLDVPEPAPPPGPGSRYGRVVYAKPGLSERLAAGGARISILGSSLQTTAKSDGTFLLGGITVSQGDLLFRYDSDADGAFDRQRLF